MSIRFCTLNYCQIFADSCSIQSLRRILETEHRSMIVLTDADGRYAGFVGPKDLHGMNYKVHVCSATVGPQFFLDAQDVFWADNALEYLPVLDPGGKLLCFCYQDYDIEKMQENILELVTFDKVADFDSFISRGRFVQIWGINEIAYYFHIFLEKHHIQHGVYGDLWEYFAPNRHNLPHPPDDRVMNYLAEGNYGLPICEGAFGKVVLEWNPEDYKALYDYYRINCQYHDIVSRQQLQNSLGSAIRSGKPFMLARIGNTEISILKEYLEIENGVLRHYSHFWLDYLYNCCGFFSNDRGERIPKDIERYAQMTLEAMKECDFHVCWGKDDLAAGLNCLLDEYASATSLRISWNDLETSGCCYQHDLLQNALEGKRVLIISPFINTIAQQLPWQEKLFHPEHRFPNCQVSYLQAPETVMGNTDGYENWFAIFDDLCEKVRRTEFDVAIMGIGAYGYPLAAKIKQMGKQAISLSSYLANWFGIKMKRYCTYARINRYWNSNWTFPKETPPKGYEALEDGCYWR